MSCLPACLPAALYREGYRRMCRDGKIDAEGGESASSLFGSTGAIFTSGLEGGLGVGTGEECVGNNTTAGSGSTNINNEFS